MNFRPGQRVKKVRGAGNIGATGTVYRVMMGAKNLLVVVRTDVPVIGSDGYEHPPGVLLASLAHEWEPIVDDGLQQSTMSYEELMTSLVSKETVT